MPIHSSLRPEEEQEAISLLQDLLHIRSINPPGDEAAVAEALASHAQGRGLETRLVPVASGRPNLVVRLPGSGERPTLLLSGHSDTVPPGEAPWDHDPLSGDLVDGEIWGRGATDMKSGLAAMLVAMAALARRGVHPKGDLVLAVTIDEEVGCIGARHLRDSGELDGVGWILIGEPTNLDVVPAHRGALWLEVVAHGKTAHGSMPHLGVNAILHLAELLRWIVEKRFVYPPHPLLAPPTVNVGTIGGGVKTNVVPDRCTATLDIRTLPGQDHAAIVQEIRDLAAELVSTAPGLRIDVKVAHDMPPVETPSDHPLIRETAGAVADVVGVEPPIRGATYYTDGAVFADSGIPIVILGPGDDRLAHQPNERIPARQVGQAVRCYLALIERLLT